MNIIAETLKSLEYLELTGSSVLTDEDGVLLHRLRNLRHLSVQVRDVRFTDLTYEKGVGSSAMEGLRIRHAVVTKAALASIASHHPHLKYVNFGFQGRSVRDADFESFLRSEPCLQSLVLYGCDQLTERSIEVLSDLVPHLRHIVLESFFGESKCAKLAIETKRPLLNIVCCRYVEPTLRELGI